jgi:PAS domain S-box-containing protein
MTASDGTIVRVNETFCQWVGYGAIELIGQHRIQDLLNVGSRLLFDAHVVPLLQFRKSVAEVKVDVISQAGQLVPVLFNASRTTFEGEEFDEFAVLVVAERHRYELELLNARRSAEQALDARTEAENALREADRRKDEFLATLAHELRNPLAPMRNVLEMLSLKELTDPQVIWGREVFERQVRHMTRLVDDLLEMSRITRGKLELRIEQVDLVTVLTAAIENSRPMVLLASHELIVAIPGEPVMLQADATRLAQMIQNVLDNAAKFTPPGGKIWLSASREGAEVAIRIRDSGIGIPAASLERVFDMFSQLENAIDRSQGGLGIGLSLVRALALLHGGTVEARSEGIGKGSEFVIRLPVSEEETVDAARPRELRDANGSGRNILVVDDNQDAAVSLSMVLQIEGHHVQVAFNGTSGFEATRESRPDVVILDIGMPDINGYEVARRIRKEHWGNEIELIALTGWGQEKDRSDAFSAGFDHHFTKPADLDRLIELLQEAGNGREA